ncbi:hypothetical protein M3Y99_01334300 [Aphelenchoides fujianensis]|nr:hypothetical protein M3Y99_01334300 [Aphelenchoides fujianensis]
MLSGVLVGLWTYFLHRDVAGVAVVGGPPIIAASYFVRETTPSRGSARELCLKDFLLVCLLAYVYGMASTCLYFAAWTSFGALADRHVHGALRPTSAPSSFGGPLRGYGCLGPLPVHEQLPFAVLLAVIALTFLSWFLFMVRIEFRKQAEAKKRRIEANIDLFLRQRNAELEQKKAAETVQESEEVPRYPSAPQLTLTDDELSPAVLAKLFETAGAEEEDEEDDSETHDARQCSRKFEELKQENAELRSRVGEN